MKKTGYWVTLAGLLLIVGCASGVRRVTPYDEALRQVHQRRGNLGWDGLEVGMTFSEVERALGQRLGIPQGPGPLCDRYTSRVQVLDQALRLSFTGATQSARLAAITVLLPLGFDTTGLVDALEARLGTLTPVPSPQTPNPTKPLYQTSDGGRVFINPEEGISLGDVCVD